MKKAIEPGKPFLAPITRPLFELFSRTVFRLWCPLRVEGRENLPPMPFIICGNHNSHMDSVALIAAAGYRFDRFAMLAANDYFFRNTLVFNWFSAMVRIIPVPRTPLPDAFHQTLDLCRAFTEDRSHGLILFPEGTRSRTGAIGPFRRGASYFATELGLPVVPAYIEGTARALPVGGCVPLPHPVHVRFAAPVFPAKAGLTRERDYILSQLRERIVALEATSHGA